MSQFSSVVELAVRGFKRFLRDVVCPIFGLYLVYQLARGRFETAAIPFIVALASAMIGIPIWTRADENERQNGGDDDPQPGGRSRRPGRITIDIGRERGDKKRDEE